MGDTGTTAWMGVMRARCGLCGHEMAPDQCGYASVDGVPLCHHDTHSCYHRWTVYGVRPEDDDA